MKRKENADERAELHTGIIASTIANGFLAQSRGKNKPKPFSPEDFMPSRISEKKKEMQSSEAQYNFIVMFNSLVGGKDMRKQEQLGVTSR